VLELPWLADVSARARGIEAMVQQRVGAWTATAVGATGRAQIEHPQLAGGRPLAAPGSRDHRLSLLADGPLGRGVSLAVAWTLASGLPNPLAPLRPAEPETLGAMRRLDVRLSARRQVGGAVVSGALAVRNATERRGPRRRRARRHAQRAAAVRARHARHLRRGHPGVVRPADRLVGVPGGTLPDDPPTP
jgi:hypothetical protein